MLRKDLLLTYKQKCLLMAVVMTDGWVELGKGAKNYRVGLVQGHTHYDVLEKFSEEMAPFVTRVDQERLKSGPSKANTLGQHKKKHGTKTARTIRHAEITKFCLNFIEATSNKKGVPNIEFLTAHLNWYSFAWMVMCDGSAHDPGRSQGMKLHLQNYSYEQQTLVCLALYHKLGIQCWPAFHAEYVAGIKQYHVRISGRSLHQIRPNVIWNTLHVESGCA